MSEIPVTGLILAGGQSSRFGSDKASALLRGRPLLQWVLSALEPAVAGFVVVTASGQALPSIECARPLSVAVDRYAGKGPLAGLVSGFLEVRTDFAFAMSCDAPLIRPSIVELLRARAAMADVVCPLVEGHLQPLVALYRVDACLPVFRACVESDRLKITAAYGGLRLEVVSEADVREADPELRSFRNVNRPERLAEIEQTLGP